MPTMNRFWAGKVIVLLALLFGMSTAASAAFIFTAQQRYVFGQLGGQLGSAGPQQINATDFGLFDATTNLTVPTYGGSANQHQRSELLSDAITVLGDSDCFRPAEVGTGTATTHSYPDVRFDLPAATDVMLSASGVAFSSGIPIHRIILSGPAGSIVNWDAFNSGTLFPQGSGSRSSSFTLAPGSYQFIVDMSSHNSNSTSNNDSVPNFNVALTVPEPGGVSLICGVFALMASRHRHRSRNRLRR